MKFYKVYLPEKVQEVEALGMYVSRYFHISAVGKGGSAPQRDGDLLDEWDNIFLSKKDFDAWYKKTLAGLSELDQVMNYCEYFVRDKGNEGNYVREGKSFPVNGLWDGDNIGCLHTEDTHFLCCKTKPFVTFLKENGWDKNWFKLHSRYGTAT